MPGKTATGEVDREMGKSFQAGRDPAGSHDEGGEATGKAVMRQEVFAVKSLS